MNKFKVGMIATAVVLVMCVVGFLMCTETIKPGYEGVIYNANGGIESHTLKQGWHMLPPWKHVTQYPISRETIMYSAENDEGKTGDTSIAIGSKEGKYLKVNVSLVARCDVSKLPDLFTMFKGQEFDVLKEGIIKQTVKAELTKVSTQYPMFDIYSAKRGEVSALAQKAVGAKLERIGVIVESLDITGVTLDKETQAAVDSLQKATMQQKQVEAEAKANQAQAEAQVAVAKAEAEKAKAQAEVTVATAQGEASATIAKAEGEAKANQLISQSLSPQILQLKMKEMDMQIMTSFGNKWNGSVPSTFFSGNGTNGQMPYLPIQLPAEKQ